MTADLLTIGAGPKAVAVAAKAAVLGKLGLPTATVQLVDPLGVGGYWRARGGWTDGRHRLGTPPEKDVGFPYRTRIAGEHSRRVDEELARHGWAAFLIDSGRYAAWVDRGRPAPAHEQWADYLQWVVDRLGIPVLRAAVTAAHLREDHWEVETTEGTHRARALMPTGPGSSDRCIATAPGVFSLASFWAQPVPEGARVAVIGSGESSASVVEHLLASPAGEITVVSPSAAIYTRGEGQFENRLYTDPHRWGELDEQARREILARTDRSVYSVRIQQRAALDERVEHRRGTVAAVERTPSRALAVSYRYRLPGGDTGQGALEADLVVDARGNSALWFGALLGEDTRERLAREAGAEAWARLRPQHLEERIDASLRFEGLDGRLFLPTLAGYRHGPGFANLSCLGELSDRIVTGTKGL
ncbi:SidA/IucD/PvdA family monooxygenase [Corynebacterium sp. zg-331]|uniref:SidA/IucD/PvdA family monooxygenase n=1 Tax=unclassified Corynebacterium TaxID=2624378 RepID=UPI00128D0C06|nr:MULTISPECIES: SidA/IucD/PvdA family monooxygenase [unclassified Corynebacterium]MBC3185624.1 SidA/IucD/PvdA family monooxygenase [Corynebacterium sp. zg-331]MPV52118.1 SidA/IucD/PvdA family monooxygenase [Corynebacterium sp. zg331]